MSETRKTEQQSLSAQHRHSHCLLCGQQNPNSLRLVFEKAGKDTVQAWFRTNPGLQGYDNILHGGVVAALLDAAMANCLFHQNIRAVTGDLRVRFVKPVPCDVFIKIKAWITAVTPPLYRLRSELLLDDKRLAWAESRFMQTVYDKSAGRISSSSGS